MGRIRGGEKVMALPWRSMLVVAAVALQMSASLQLEDGVATLEGDDKYDPSIKPHKLAEVEKIRDFGTMSKYIQKRMKEVVKTELTKKGGENEEIEIGNTLKNMEAKHAVEAELNQEMKVDCEIGEWGKWSQCSKLCDGGKKLRKRPVTQSPKNGGKECPPIENDMDCNTESCSSENYARRALRRKLTHEERQRERARNNLRLREALRSKSTKVMGKMVHTDVAEVKLPGQKGDRTAESLVRKDLKAAMAKNATNKSLKTFE